jgi:hypothetical protein
MAKKSSISKTLLNLVLLLPSLLPSILGLLSNLTSLIRIEAGAAGKRLTALIILAITIGFLLVSSWLCLLALLFIYLTSLHLTMTMCIVTLLITNLILLSIVSLVALRIKNNLLHPFIDR